MEHAISFTGHRFIALRAAYMQNKDWVWQQLDEIIRRAMQKGATWAVTGGALYTDQWAAWRCHEARLPYEIAEPGIDFWSRWKPEHIDYYMRNIRPCAAKVTVLSNYDERNRYMVDQGEMGLIAVWDGDPSGTGNTVQYAQRVGRRVYQIDPARKCAGWMR
jgi:uncharacterized phage-like protein YoqJ